MYEGYWQLECRPFENVAEEKFYFPSEAHQAAMLKLRYAVENHRGAALLGGVAGLGKSMLVRALFDQLNESFQPQVHMVFPQMPPEQLLAYLAEELGAPRTANPATIDQIVRGLQRTLSENAGQGRHAVVVIDEAHLLASSAALETIRLLLNFQFEDRPAMTVLLVGQPALLPELDRTPELEERLDVKCLLRRFQPAETRAYLDHRLSVAGASRPIFDETAYAAIHTASDGIPRRINRLGDLALLVGFAEERDTIGAAQIDSIAGELMTVAPE